MLATDILPIFDLTEQEKIDVLKVISLHGVNVSQLSVPYLSMFRKADATGRITNKDTRKDYEPRRFHKPTLTPKFNVTFLVGLPCSRKSTYAKSLGLDILSRDDLLTSQHPALSYNQAYSLVHSNPDSLAKFNQSFEQHITSKARAGKNLIIDMTMLSLKSRRSMMTHSNTHHSTQLYFYLNTLKFLNAMLLVLVNPFHLNSYTQCQNHS